MSRDPVGEHASVNVYYYLSNHTTDSMEFLGLLPIPLSPPKTEWKCNLVAALMALYSISTPINHFLWTRWLKNLGGSECLEYSAFDPYGINRVMSRMVVADDLKNAEA